MSLEWTWTPEGLAACGALLGGAYELLRRGQPKIGVRWFVSHDDLGIEVYNDGGRTVDVDLELVNLDKLRGAEHFIYTRRNRWHKRIRPGEEVQIKVTSPFTADWIDKEDPDPSHLIVTFRYKRWWMLSEQREELAWADFFNDLIPQRTANEQIAHELKEARQFLRQEWNFTVKRTLRSVERGLCEHAYNEKGRFKGEFCEKCDTSRDFLEMGNNE